MKVSQSKQAAALGLLLVAVIGIGAIGGVYYAVVPSQREALQAFIEYGREPTEAVTEDMQMDPLIVARGDVVPAVLTAVAATSMPKRRYAIAFLGNSGRREALPSLEKILRDEHEEPVFRGDALDAIAMIDAERSRQLCPEFSVRSDYLGSVARDLMSGMWRTRRSYATALRTFLCVRLTGC